MRVASPRKSSKGILQTSTRSSQNNVVAIPGGGDAELASVAAEANAVLLRSRDALGLAYHNHACSQNKSHLPTIQL